MSVSFWPSTNILIHSAVRIHFVKSVHIQITFLRIVFGLHKPLTVIHTKVRRVNSHCSRVFDWNNTEYKLIERCQMNDFPETNAWWCLNTESGTKICKSESLLVIVMFWNSSIRLQLLRLISIIKTYLTVSESRNKFKIN